jgi:aminomuconate-semialdehyde/2-hydroxymuconate-6-semialdehyde dehydrogenase
VIDCYVDGAAVTTSKQFDNINPATGKAVSSVSEATRDVVDRAVQAAKRAQREWKKVSPQQRAAGLRRIADEIDRRRDELVFAEVMDTGKPITLARTFDIPRAAANFRAFADQLVSMPQEAFDTFLDDGRRAQNLVVHDPLGVVGVPLLLMTWKVAPALAAGNAVVVKPSEETPHTATLLGDIVKSAGLPNGLYNVVHGFGAGSAGEFIVEHPDVAAVTFTGESKTGSAIMKAAAPSLKRLSFELGGKNAAVVFADADVDAAIAGTLRSTLLNTGQVCLCTERVYVERSIFQRVVDGLVAGAHANIIGDPMDIKTTMGPLISQTHETKVLSAFASAQAHAVTGGGKVDVAGHAGGFFVAPTFFVGMGHDHAVVRDEIFGPCAALIPFDDEDEAVAQANATDYGLCAAVWTQNISRAQRVSRAIDAGLVWVNTWYLRDLRTPFGGRKKSGIGREGGRYSFDFYAEPKNICTLL